MEMQVGDLTESSLRIAEAIAAYNVLKVLAAVSITLLIVLVLYYLFDIHMRRKQTTEITKSYGDLANFVKQTTEDMKKTSLREIGIDQTRNIISTVLEMSKTSILFFVGKTMQRNNLADKEAITEKVNLFVDKIYGQNVSVLNKFDYRQRALSGFLESAWKEEVKGKILEEFERFDSEKGMDCYQIEAKYSALFDKFKLAMNHRIDEIT